VLDRNRIPRGLDTTGLGGVDTLVGWLVGIVLFGGWWEVWLAGVYGALGCVTACAILHNVNEEVVIPTWGQIGSRPGVQFIS
jgi:hypothetical protein